MERVGVRCCKRCGSPDVIKGGEYKGQKVWRCKRCGYGSIHTDIQYLPAVLFPSAEDYLDDLVFALFECSEQRHGECDDCPQRDQCRKWWDGKPTGTACGTLVPGDYAMYLEEFQAIKRKAHNGTHQSRG